MAKRTRIPAPVPRWIPSIVRTFGPRLVLVAGCAALLLIGGSSYLVARITAPAEPEPQKAKLSDSKSSHAQVLGDSTVQPNSEQPPDGGGSPATGASSPTSSTPQNTNPSTTSGASPVCSQSCASTGSTPSTTVQPSFDIVVDPAAIQKRTLGALYVPFSVVRRGSLSTPISPIKVTISSGGSLTNLITVQSAVMLDSDNGAITLLPIGLFPRDISVKVSAASGSATANTLFSYHISR